MNRKRLFLVILMTVFVCLNPLPVLAQWWDGWDSWWDSGYYSYYEYEEYYPPPAVYYSQPPPIVIGIGGCKYDD